MDSLISLFSSIAEKLFKYFFKRHTRKYLHDKKIAERSMKIFPEDIKISLANHYFEGNYYLSHTKYIDDLIYFQGKQENHFFDKKLNQELSHLINILADLNEFFAINNDDTQIPEIMKLSNWAKKEGAQTKLEKLTREFEKAYATYRSSLKKKFFI